MSVKGLTYTCGTGGNSTLDTKRMEYVGVLIECSAQTWTLLYVSDLADASPRIAPIHNSTFGACPSRLDPYIPVRSCKKSEGFDEVCAVLIARIQLTGKPIPRSNVGDRMEPKK